LWFDVVLAGLQSVEEPPRVGYRSAVLPLGPEQPPYLLVRHFGVLQREYMVRQGSAVCPVSLAPSELNGNEERHIDRLGRIPLKEPWVTRFLESVDSLDCWPLDTTEYQFDQQGRNVRCV